MKYAYLIIYARSNFLFSLISLGIWQWRFKWVKLIVQIKHVHAHFTVIFKWAYDVLICVLLPLMMDQSAAFLLRYVCYYFVKEAKWPLSHLLELRSTFCIKRWFGGLHCVFRCEVSFEGLPIYKPENAFESFSNTCTQTKNEDPIRVTA